MAGYRQQLGNLPTAAPLGAPCAHAFDSLLVFLLQGVQSNARGGPFAVLNGSLAQDALIIALPAGATVSQPLHLLHVSTAAAADTSSSNGGGRMLNASAARLLIRLAGNANLEVVEEFVSASAADGAHLAMPVAEVVLGEGSALKHGYVNREAQGASHFKATLVTQVGNQNQIKPE
jgi:Fe-S cluster assembly protein SufD